VRILVANDDGIYSPGLKALADAATGFGEVCVVAPDVEQSSMGHAITHARPLRIRRTPIGDFESYRVNGTPADCVALGNELFGPFDFVLSGVNLGYNLGNSMWHSGTLAAAKQAVLLGLRGIALSTPARSAPPSGPHRRDEEDPEEEEAIAPNFAGSIDLRELEQDHLPDFDRLRPWIERSLETVFGDESLRLVNVNLPPQPTGICWARQSVRHYDGHVLPGADPYGRRHYWIAVRPLEEVEEGSDRWAVRNGMVALTPLRLDLTDAAVLAEVSSRLAP
jgi:5'-nucleotidase